MCLINSTSQFTWVKNPKKYVKKESGTFKTLLNLQAGKNPVVSDSLKSYGLYSPWNSPDQNTGVSSLSLLQGFSQPRDGTQVFHTAGGFFTS